MLDSHWTECLNILRFAARLLEARCIRVVYIREIAGISLLKYHT